MDVARAVADPSKREALPTFDCEEASRRATELVTRTCSLVRKANRPVVGALDADRDRREAEASQSRIRCGFQGGCGSG
jgi:hypothetical protein